MFSVQVLTPLYEDKETGMKHTRNLYQCQGSLSWGLGDVCSCLPRPQLTKRKGETR